MKGIFVNSNGCVPYAMAIVTRIKPIETRSRDMLKSLVGERVAIIETRRNKKPMIVGYATITGKEFCKAEDFRKYYDLHLVPEGSSYDCHGKGKWFYYMADAETCEPYALPGNATRHGFSWAEF